LKRADAQIAELYARNGEFDLALRFCQAEKMYYERQLIGTQSPAQASEPAEVRAATGLPLMPMQALEPADAVRAQVITAHYFILIGSDTHWQAHRRASEQEALARLCLQRCQETFASDTPQSR
jgi:hypothetical protein